MQNSNATGPETVQLNSSGNAAWDIAHHLCARILVGKTLIVTDEPERLQKQLYKYWSKIYRKLLMQRAGTYNAALMADLSKTIALMQALEFAIGEPFDHPMADVFIVTPHAVNDLLPDCATVYIAGNVSAEDTATLQTLLPQALYVCNYT